MSSSNNSALKMEKLCDENFHAWKRKIELILSLRDVEGFLEPDAAPREDDSAGRRHGSRRIAKSLQ